MFSLFGLFSLFSLFSTTNKSLFKIQHFQYLLFYFISKVCFCNDIDYILQSRIWSIHIHDKQINEQKKNSKKYTSTFVAMMDYVLDFFAEIKCVIRWVFHSKLPVAFFRHFSHIHTPAQKKNIQSIFGYLIGFNGTLFEVHRGQL